MVTVSIGQSQMEMNQVDEAWINQQLNGRRADGRSVCAQVQVRTADIDMVLSTPYCSRGGGGRQANARELRIFQEWDQHHLNSPTYTGGQLIAFLRALRRLI